MKSAPGMGPVPSPAFPRRLLALGMAAVVLMVALSSLLTWKVGNQVRAAMKSEVEVLRGAERLAHHGDVLELSIKAVIATGDSEAAARYRRVQPELRRTLTRLRTQLHLGTNRGVLLQVDRADMSLIAMEYEALDLVARGDFARARALIGGRRYASLTDVYFKGIRGIEQRAADHVAATEKEVDRDLSRIFGLSLASFLVLLIGWATVVRPARRWGEQLDVAREAAENAWTRLAKSQADLEEANQRLFDQARIDPLTGLQTRLKFGEDVEQTWSRVSRYRESYSMVMCDIDFFKQYNDSYGHVAGDEVLRQVADAFTRAARAGDQLYRYGGEEFVLLLQRASLEAGQACAERFRAAVEALRIPHVGSPMGFVSVSMGVAQLDPGDRLTAAGLLQLADAAMYEAKGAGRNRVAIRAAA